MLPRYLVRHHARPWSAIAAFALLTASTLAVPPKVASIVPDNADAVDASACTELVITFDQGMSRSGQSLCGGGPTFPPIIGKPTWRDDHTFVVPVKLEAGREYAFSVNCPGARNFRSATGEPAEAYPVSFRTLGPGEAPAPFTGADAARAVEALKQAFFTRYSYRTRLKGVSWEDEFAKATPAMLKATSSAEFARAAATLLAAAQDPHVWVRAGTTPVPVYRRSATMNFDARRIEANMPGLVKHNDTVWTGAFPDGVGYILITGWPGGPTADAALAPALEALTKFAAGPGIVIDVRPNGGGDERAARSIASRFVDRPTVYSSNDIVDPSRPDGFTERFMRTLEPAPASAGPRVTARTAVLIGPACLSSNESFIAMMRPLAPGPGASVKSMPVVLVGDTTGGSSGNPKPHDLGAGVTVFLPSWRDFLADGSLLEGRGITPDIGVVWGPGAGGAAGSSDPVLAAALAWLRASSKGEGDSPGAP
jgi:hypothetical protein